MGSLLYFILERQYSYSTIESNIKTGEINKPVSSIIELSHNYSPFTLAILEGCL